MLLRRRSNSEVPLGSREASLKGLEPRRTFGLSKSRVMAGRQCHKLLWWMVHEPGALELQLDDLGAAVMEQGTRVGELARTYVPGGFLVDCHTNTMQSRSDWRRPSKRLTAELR